jgi:hypothetical protein
MRVGKTIIITTSPKRNVRKAGEKPNPWKEQPIPVEIPKKKKVKKEEEVSVSQDFNFHRDYVNTRVSVIIPD